jgi:predicted nucleotidyltransferase
VQSLKVRPLFVTVSGAHLYGFDSPDSDVDLRGAHLLPLQDVIPSYSPPLAIWRRSVVWIVG